MNPSLHKTRPVSVVQMLSVLYLMMLVQPVISSEDIKFQSIGTAEGLSRGLVKAFAMDDFGMLWVATENGLNRYDGYHFEVYRNQPEYSGSLPDNHVLSLLYSRKHGILAGMRSGKLAKYDYRNEIFVPIYIPEALTQAFSNSEPDFLFEDPNGIIWVASTNGLFAIDITNQAAWHFHPGNSGLKTQYIKHIFVDSEKRLWLATDAGLAQVTNCEHPSMVSIKSFDPGLLPNPYMKRITEDKKGQLWLGTDGGMTRFDPETAVFHETISHNQSNNNGLPNNYIKAMITDRNGKLWIGHDLGISVFDPDLKSFVNYSADFDDKNGLTNNYVKCLLEDEDGIIWVGTDNGISMYDHEKEPFHSLVHRPGEGIVLQGNVVYEIYEDSPERIWIATNNGLHKWNRLKKQMIILRHDPLKRNSISSNIVRSVTRDALGRLWIGTDAGLNYQIDEKRGFSFGHIDAGAQDGKHLSDPFVVAMQSLSDNRLWVGTWGGGLNIVEPENLWIEYLNEQPNSSGQRLRNNKTANIFQDSKGNIWLRSNDIVDPVTRTVKPFPFDQILENINFFFEDNQGRVWIGTTSTGLFYWDPGQNKLNLMQTPPFDGLGVVAGMLQDSAEHLWIAADKTIIRLSPQLDQLQTFDASEGLHGGDFNIKAARKGSDGILYFGGNDGITYFKPDEIKLNTKPVKVCFTDLWLNNELLKPQPNTLLDSSMFMKRSIVLPYNHRELAIGFTGINFTNPHKNIFAFRIEGLQYEWVYAKPDQRTANYFRRPPGEYRFQVKAANSSGIWNEEPAELIVIVLAPWYLLWWVRVLFVLTAGLLVYATIIWRTKKLQHQKLYLEQKVAERTAQLEHQKEEIELKNKQLQEASKAKSEFLANMSHEIRTPLNGVIGFTDLVLKTDLSSTQKEYLNIVGQSAESLLNIINDILDFSKIEAGKLELFVEKTDIYELSSQSVDIITYQAQNKGLELLLNIPANLPRFIFTDTIRLKQVIVNLLSNAVKFTQSGEIELKISLLSALENGSAVFRISVRDTGIGIQSEKLSLIFEAFTQEDSSTTKRFGGTGLGLTISNRILELMGSRLQVESVPNEGSNFFFDIRFSCDNSPFDHPIAIQWLKKALIVDDNQNNRTILRKMLEYFVIDSDEANSGTHALQQLKSGGPYDVIFMDYHMPVHDGIESVRMIREQTDPTIKNIRIVLWHSSSDDESLAMQCKELGIDKQLTKPVKIRVLIQALTELGMPDARIEKTSSDSYVFEGKYNVLLVEDNPVNMLLSKTIVHKLLPEAVINEAINGSEAIEICRNDIPDIIFMDLQMPVTNGYEATQLIRSLPNGESVPIIALTAGNIKGEKEKCFSVGMNDFLTKPVIEKTISDTIIRWLNPTVMSFHEHKNENDNSVEFSIEKLKSILGNDPLFLQEFMNILHENLISISANFDKYLVEKNLVALRDESHKLRGTALSIQLEHLANLAYDLEKVQSIEEKNTTSLVHEIQKHIKTLLISLNEKKLNE